MQQGSKEQISRIRSGAVLLLLGVLAPLLGLGTVESQSLGWLATTAHVADLDHRRGIVAEPNDEGAPDPLFDADGDGDVLRRYLTNAPAPEEVALSASTSQRIVDSDVGYLATGPPIA